MNAKFQEVRVLGEDIAPPHANKSRKTASPRNIVKPNPSDLIPDETNPNLVEHSPKQVEYNPK